MSLKTYCSFNLNRITSGIILATLVLTCTTFVWFRLNQNSSEKCNKVGQNSVMLRASGSSTSSLNSISLTSSLADPIVYVADKSVVMPRSNCSFSKPSRVGKWQQNDCAMIPLKNNMRNKLMWDMLVVVEKILKKHTPQGSVPPTLAGGTLIGAIREGDLLPWTRDTDLDVSPELYSKVDSNSGIFPTLYMCMCFFFLIFIFFFPFTI